MALQYHDARYLCGVKGRSDWTMSTFCFINAASRYHDSPVKQRAVHKDSKGGIATPGAFPSFTDKQRTAQRRFLFIDQQHPSVFIDGI